MKGNRIIRITAVAFFIMIIILLIVFLNRKEKPLRFTIKGKVKEQLILTHEYGEALDLSPEALQLEAKKGNDVYEIFYEEPAFTELKTYHISYRVKDEDAVFSVKVKVVDTTAPKLSGEIQYTITQGEAFGIHDLYISAYDAYDGDLSDQLHMEEIDTSQAGEQEHTVSVHDSSGNRAEILIHITVKEKSTSYQSPSDNSGKTIVSDPEAVSVLLNKTHALPNGWAPNDLTAINSNSGAVHYMRKEAAEKWEEMRSAALNDGIVIYVVSSYRTQAYQTGLYNRYMASDPQNAQYYSAYPRTSEHELGLAIDVSYDWQLHHDLQTSALGEWINQHGWKYGWIMRYPQNKTNLTGYIFEPWHYRYVGVALATKLNAGGLTMEEYFDK